MMTEQEQMNRFNAAVTELHASKRYAAIGEQSGAHIRTRKAT